MILTLPEKEMYRKKCIELGSNGHLRYTEAYVVYYSCFENGIWTDDNETYLADNKYSHEEVEKRFLKDFAGGIANKTIVINCVVYQ